MTSIGRNDPCPCGSGKKYKRCHLPVDEAAAKPPAERAAASHAIDHQLVEEMVRFARKRFPDEFPPVPVWADDLAGSVEELQLLVPWSLFHYRVRGKPVAAWFQAERGWSRSAAEQSWLQASLCAWLSAWEVTEVRRGESISLTDLLTGEQRLVHEKSGSEVLDSRHVLLTRVVDHDGVSVLAGSHATPLPPAQAALLVAGMRRGLKVRGKRNVRVDELRPQEATEVMIALWYRLVAQLHEEAENRAVPQLRNTDGEDFVWTTDRFTLAPASRAHVESRLLALEGAVADEPQSGKTGIVFTKRGSGAPGAWESTTIGRAEVADTQLELQCNSVERADALRQRVEEACAGLVTHRLREHQSVEAMLAEHRSRPAEPRREPTPEEVAIVRDFKEKHYAGWLDTPLPALAGKTPRQAARTARDRRKLDLLLKEVEHQESRLPEAERYDFRKVRIALGLDPCAGEKVRVPSRRGAC